MIIESAAKTDVGKKRDTNEDSYFVDPDLRSFIVADGMGGHQAGEVASRLVVETMGASLKHYLNDGGQLESDVVDEALSLEANMLLASIREANKAVYQDAQESLNRRGMGSTVACVLCTDYTIISANVGDSPIYLVRDGEIAPLSKTHTVEAELSAIDPQKALHIDRRYQSMLTRAVGTEEVVWPDVFETQFFDNDIIVICSDGLSNKVTSDEMLDIVENNSPEEACRLFVGLANGRGGEDNITVIVLKLIKREHRMSRLLRFITNLFTRD